MAKDNQISDIICNVGGKNKFFDMRNALVLAHPEDYAMIHGCGGSKHAPTSGIMLTITDYSKGVGDKSVFVHGIIPLFVIDKMLSVCRLNAGDYIGSNADIATALTTINAKVERVFAGILSGTAKAVNACSNIVNGKGHVKGPMADLGQVVLTIRNCLGDNEAKINEFSIRESHAEFAYHQERVNKYRVDPKDGFVFVSIVDIGRKQYTDKGEQRKYPWAVKIKNFYAPPKEQENGTTAYSAADARDAIECFIQITDDDMHRCCYTTEHFIRVWENAMAIPRVLEAIESKRRARQSGN